MSSALDGVRILDLADGTAGPMACMLLADLGADVLRIETSPRPGVDPGAVCWHRNKRAAHLDPERASDRDRLRDLLTAADVAVVDGRDRFGALLGLDREAVGRLNPGLLHVRLPQFAPPGWWDRLPADDLLAWGMSGGAFAQFSWEDVPVQLVTPQLAYAQAMWAAASIAAGLVERLRSGLGQRLTISALHASAAIQSGATVFAGEPLAREPRGAQGAAPQYKLYECADGEWLFLATLMPHHFLQALEAMDLRVILEMEGVEGRFENVLRAGIGGRVRARLQERFRERPRDEWLRILHEHGVPRGPVGERGAWFDSETVAANGMRVTLEHPDLGRVDLPGVPVRLSETPGRVRALLQSADLAAVADEWCGQAPPRPDPGVPPAAPAGPLAGIRVLDLGAIIAAPFATTLLASLGADVIKVEPPSGDSFRGYGLGFVGWNQGKRSIALDLKRADGREHLLALVRSADVICENYRVGVMQRLGLDYGSLRRVNPRIVAASITAYGSTGPLAADPGFDPVLQARSGLMRVQGGDGDPVFHQIAVNDTASAMVAALGISAALYARGRTGRGQRVETSLTCQSVLCQAAEMTRYRGRPESAEGGTDCTGIRALERFYRCADEWIGLSCDTADQFRGVCAALERPDWLTRWDPRKALEADRNGPLAAELAAALAALTRDDALARLHERDVPAAPALRMAEIFSHPLHVESRLFEERPHPTFGGVTAVRGYADWSRTPGGFVRTAPLLDEHREEILAEAGIEDPGSSPASGS